MTKVQMFNAIAEIPAVAEMEGAVLALRLRHRKRMSL